MLKIKTRELQDMISKVGKCYSNNLTYPMTSMLFIRVEDGKLRLVTTDMTNYFYAQSSNVSGEDFYVSVLAELFIKLVNSTTSEYVELELKQNARANTSYLEYRGNGVYKFDVYLDENGEIVKFKDCPELTNQLGTIKPAVIRNVLNLVKPALATKVELPCYTNYFVGDVILATDTEVINSLDVDLFSSKEPLFIGPELMDLIGALSDSEDDDIDVFMSGNDILFTTENNSVFSTLYSYAQQYRVDDIMAVTKQEFSSSCGVDRVTLLQLLDRMSLFLGTDDDRAITLTFSKNKLLVASAISTGAESIDYIYTENILSEDTSYKINLDKLKSQVKAQSEDVINLWYGSQAALKLTSEKFISMIGYIAE